MRGAGLCCDCLGTAGYWICDQQYGSHNNKQGHRATASHSIVYHNVYKHNRGQGKVHFENSRIIIFGLSEVAVELYSGQYSQCHRLLGILSCLTLCR